MPNLKFAQNLSKNNDQFQVTSFGYSEEGWIEGYIKSSDATKFTLKNPFNGNEINCFCFHPLKLSGVHINELPVGTKVAVHYDSVSYDSPTSLSDSESISLSVFVDRVELLRSYNLTRAI